MTEVRKSVTHKFPPFYRQNSEILILGSFPSVKSREAEFYYAHPQNRFWRVLAACFDCDLPITLPDKMDFLEANKIALWDVIEQCEIIGSSDASIRSAVPTDLIGLIDRTSISRVILNGKTAERYFYKFHTDFPLTPLTLPSTSSANASWNLERLMTAWRAALRD